MSVVFYIYKNEDEIKVADTIIFAAHSYIAEFGNYIGYKNKNIKRIKIQPSGKTISIKERKDEPNVKEIKKGKIIFLTYVNRILFDNKLYDNPYHNMDIQYNDVIKNMYRDRRVYDKNNIEYKYNSGISPQEGNILYSLICRNKDIKKIIEIGMAFGTSALYMCQALNDSKRNGCLISVDPYQSSQWHCIGATNIKRANLTSYHKLVENRSDIYLAELLAKGHKYDMIFIDGMHLFDYTLVDFYYASMLVRIGGIIVVDDARHAGVNKALKYVDLNYKHLERLQLPNNTMALYQKKTDDNRQWNFHINF